MNNNQEINGTKKIFGVLLPSWVDEEVLKKLVYSFLGLMVAVLVSSLFVWPRFSDLYKDERSLFKLEQTLKVLSNSVDEVEGFEVSFGDTEIGALAIAVPRTFDPALILSSLRQVSSKVGVILESYTVDNGVVVLEEFKEFGNKSDSVVLKKHKVDLKLMGRSERLIKFIDLLGNSSPISVISELSLSEISKLFNQEGVSQLEMQVTYFESVLADVDPEKITSFSSENGRLLEEIVLYSAPNSAQDEVSGQVENRGSIFGF